MPRHLPPFPPDLVAEARRRHLRGASQQELAALLGTTQQTVGRRIREWGWGPAKRRGARPHAPKFTFLIGPADADVEERQEAQVSGSLPDRIRRLVEREIRRLETCGRDE